MKTNFQYVSIYDVLRAPFQNLEGYKKSLADHDSYHATHVELFEPDRIVFLDGVLQSRRSGDAAYHESLVHPAMFAHNNPRRVAIIGGGEGATLREVLKHKTVERVMMIEIDKKMVELSKEYLPSWSDCSILIGSTPNCFDDPRVDLRYMDAFQWFVDTFPSDKPYEDEQFDVIIMDALDPQVQKDYVNALYNSSDFLRALPNALSNNGIFVAQVGEDAGLLDPAEVLSLDVNRVRFKESLVLLGFEVVRDYTDRGYSGFEKPWQFVVAFKDGGAKAEWFSNAGLVDLKIHKRALSTIEGTTPFTFFDGPTMQMFYYPSKQSERVFCLHNIEVNDCVSGHGFEPLRQNLRSTDILEVRSSTLGEHAGRGVFAKVDIPQSSYVGLDKLIPIIHGSAKTYKLMTSWYYRIPWVCEFSWGEILEAYADGYGHIFAHNVRLRLGVFNHFLHHTLTNGLRNYHRERMRYLSILL